MAFSVPLVLEVSIAVIHRLDTMATKEVAPYTGATSGYDKDFREPIAFDAADDLNTVRETTRIELPEVRVPCQVEVAKYEELRQLGTGDMPDSQIQLVFHRRDLLRLKLIDLNTGKPLLKVNDRLSSLESSRRSHRSIVPLDPPGVYIHTIMPASFGFGDDGHDLYLAYFATRERAR